MRARRPLADLIGAAADPCSLSQLHSLLIRSGRFTALAPLLTDAHINIASFKAARQLFDEIFHPSVSLCRAALRACFRSRRPSDALAFLRLMPNHQSDADVLYFGLKACAALAAPAASRGRALHAVAIKSDFYDSSLFVCAALVEFYSKCGDMDKAIRTFDRFKNPDVVLRTTVVSGYEQNGHSLKALAFFADHFVNVGIVPSPVTLISVMSAACQATDVRLGRSCHAYALKNRLVHDLLLTNAILNFYVQSNKVMTAEKLFKMSSNRDVVTWSTMIAGHVSVGDPAKALHLYRSMGSLRPNRVTVIAVLQACSLANEIHEGRQLHHIAVKGGYEMRANVATALIDMYMKCSCPDEAMKLFHRMPNRDAVVWAAVISGLTFNGMPDESMRVFKAILSLGRISALDPVVIVKVLVACSVLSILPITLSVHGYTMKSGFSDNVFVRAALTSAYSKCGRLHDAVCVFDHAVHKDHGMWTAAIAAYGAHGAGCRALALLQQMVTSDVKPNDMTFTVVLSACARAGLVEDGVRIFDAMERRHGVAPTSKHCGIMVDLLARAGQFRAAASIIEGIEGPVHSDVWCALLAGCRVHGDTVAAKAVAGNLLRVGMDRTGCYNLVSGFYAAEENWEGARVVKEAIGDKGLRRTPGCSSVVVDDEARLLLAS